MRQVCLLKEAYATAEYVVRLKTEDGWLPGRICVVRKSEAAIALAVHKLKRAASSYQRALQCAKLEFAQYIR